MSILPLETNPKLLVDPDAVLSFSVPTEAFQSIPRRHREFPDLSNAVDLIEFSPGCHPQWQRTTFPGGSRFYAVKNVLRAAISKRPYHASYYNALRYFSPAFVDT